LPVVRDPTLPIHGRLTPRELRIFCYLANGVSITTVARELGVSARTVSTYRCRILNKARFSSNSDLTRYALRYGLMQ